MTQGVIDKFAPEHISGQVPDDMESLKKEVEKSTQTGTEEKDLANDPRSNIEYTFQFKWENPSGKVFEGQFTNRILSIGQQQSVGLMRSRLSGGMPFDSLDPLTVEINLIMAHLTFSLTEKPSWAEKLTDIHEIELIQAIYMEVASHEAVFRGHSAITEGS